MEKNHFTSLEKALEVIVVDEQDHVLLHHTLTPGEDVDKHYHPKVDEYLLLNSGRVVVSLENATEEIAPINEWVTIKFPAGKMHELRALENTSYYVLRTGYDELIWKENPKT